MKRRRDRRNGSGNPALRYRAPFRAEDGARDDGASMKDRHIVARSIAGWKLDQADRSRLLDRFPSRYAQTVADHVTLRFGTDRDTPLPTVTGGEVIGVTDDEAGVQALVVRIDGATERGDGSHFHLTWSLEPGREARESNDVIAAHGWRPVEPPIAIRIEPARWPA